MPHYICTECGVTIDAVAGGGALYHCQGAGRMQETEIPDAVLELAPTRRLVYLKLRGLEPCLGQDVYEAMEKSPGTVYDGLHDLEDAGVVHSRPRLTGNMNATIWATSKDVLDVDTADLEAD